MDETWDTFMSHLQQRSGCYFSLDACVIPGLTALGRSDVELFRQVLSMYFTICALLARKADTIVRELFTRWSEDARAILMSSEVEAHRQPFNPLVKKGHVADLAAALSTDKAVFSGANDPPRTHPSRPRSWPVHVNANRCERGVSGIWWPK